MSLRVSVKLVQKGVDFGILRLIYHMDVEPELVLVAMANIADINWAALLRQTYDEGVDSSEAEGSVDAGP